MPLDLKTDIFIREFSANANSFQSIQKDWLRLKKNYKRKWDIAIKKIKNSRSIAYNDRN